MCIWKYRSVIMEASIEKISFGEMRGPIFWKLGSSENRVYCSEFIFVAKAGAEEVAGPKAAVWQSYLAPSEASWNWMQRFSVLTAGKFWFREFFKICCNVLPISLAGFVCAGFVWGSLYVWLLSSFLPALALSYVEGRVLHCKRQQHHGGQTNLEMVCTVCLCCG